MCVSERLTACFFFFNDTATTEIYTLSLHDALPIFTRSPGWASKTPEYTSRAIHADVSYGQPSDHQMPYLDRLVYSDRKSTRLNSSHSQISYAVFCLKKKTISTHPLQATCNDTHLAY